MATEDPKAKAVSDIRGRMNKALKTLSTTANAAAKSVTDQEQPTNPNWDKNEWDGNVFDTATIGKPFDRSEHNEDVNKAITNPDAPGVIGDLAISCVQGDFLAAFERAERLLHATPIRRRIHAAARQYGHGHDAGLFTRGMQTYLAGFVKLNNQES